MKPFITITFLLLYCNSFSQNYKMLVGTYNTDTVQNGIFLFDFNKKNGTTQILDTLLLSNPSFITVAPQNRLIYAVTENASKNNSGGGIASIQYSEHTQQLTLTNSVSSMGNHPCHITIDNAGKFVIAANYSSGNFCTYITQPDGTLHNLIETIQHTGNSIDTTRQKSPHAHGVFFTKKNTQIYVTDLGIDKVMSYQFNTTTGKTSPSTIPSINVTPGSGPRHLALHPNERYMYVLQELTGVVSVYALQNKQWMLIQDISNEQKDFRGKSSSAAIVISKDGKFLYCSNRGTSNHIAIFKIDKKNGQLQLIDHQSSNGVKPRNINFDPSEKFLLVANQESNNIVIFKRNKKTGKLTDIQKNIQIPKPVCITWLKN